MDNKDYKILIFDLDGTLAPSKSDLQPEMAEILQALLEKGKIIAITSGGIFKQFKNQLLANLNTDKELFKNIYLLPASGSVMYVWGGKDWIQQYANKLTDTEKKKVIHALEKVIKESDLDFPEETFGNRIEDRDTQVSMSALGQEAPLEKKKAWDPDQSKRKTLLPPLEKLLPNFHIKIGGTTTLDITHKGIDKAYGVNKFFEYTKLNKNDAIFYGDALFEGGNDYAVKKTGIPTVQVEGPEDLIPRLKKYL